MYKTLQKRKSQGLLTVDKSTEELSTLRSNNSTIRRFCVPPSNKSPPNKPGIPVIIMVFIQERPLSSFVKSCLMMRVHIKHMTLFLTHLVKVVGQFDFQ